MKRHDFEVINRYIFEIVLIFVVIFLTYVFITITGNIEGKQDLGNYFWMPSSIMQSVAAIYALFVAVLVLSIQNNQKIISLIGDLLKPPFKVVSYIVATTIYFNGLVLFIFSFRKPTELQVTMLYFGSLVSLFVSLIAIVYFSIWMISTVAGLNTYEETLCNLSQHKNIEACYRALDLDRHKWFLKSKSQQNKEIQIIIKLLEVGNNKIRAEVARFLVGIEDARAVKDARAVEQLIKNLDNNSEDVRDKSAFVLSGIGDVSAVEPLIKKLDDISSNVRSNSARALGNIGDVRAVEPLIKKLDDKEYDVRYNSVRALEKIGDARAVEPLIKRLGDHYEEVIVSSEIALGNLGDERVIEPLIRKLDDSRDRVRQFAVRALGEIGDERAIEPLTERLKDKESTVRYVSERAIDKIQKRMAK